MQVKTLDLKERKIRVNAVSPGVVPTPGYDLVGLTKEQVQAFVDFQVTTIPLGRVGIPDEIAKAVVFLASDDSSFINGIELFVDGGMDLVPLSELREARETRLSELGIVCANAIECCMEPDRGKPLAN